MTENSNCRSISSGGVALAEKERMIALRGLTEDWESKRNSEYGSCESCKKHNTFRAWCQTCDPYIEIQGLSGDTEIDNFIKEFKLKTVTY